MSSQSPRFKRQRSKTGCKNCRLRKRKCDELHPTCTFCHTRDLICKYNEIKILNPTSFKPSKRIKKVQKNPLVSCSDLIPLTTDLHFPEPIFSPILNTNALSPLILYLDDQGIDYVRQFEQIASTLSLSQSTNYIKSTFLTLAFSNEAILNLLAAWGALHYGDSDDVNKYLMLAKGSIKNPHDRFDYFTTFACYLIQMAIYINTGDTQNWFQIFRKCETMIREYGGLIKFITDFQYSNDCKFLISNFQFYDVMSSESLERGTTCTMDKYLSLFKGRRILDETYGVDPYQGCCQPIYLLLGEIMNTYVELKKDRHNIVNCESVNVRVQYYKKVNEKVDHLIQSIDKCQPTPIPDGDGLQLKLFELCCIIGRMYVLLYIKQTQPKSSEIQLLLLDAISIIDELISTHLASNLSMALLMCGITCGNKYDRQNINGKFKIVYDKFRQGNLKRIWEIVKESWERNPLGNVCIDWLDICHDFNWKISMI